MHTNLSVHIRKIFTGFMLAGILLSLLTAGGSPIVHAQDAETPQPTEQPIIRRLSLQDEKLIEEHSILGLIEPPTGFESERLPVVLPKAGDTTIESIGLPGSRWLYSCSTGAAAEIATVDDTREVLQLGETVGYKNIYDGPANNGDMPSDNSSWPTWSDGYDTYPNNPLIASHKNVDSRTTRGTIDDYWVSYNSTAPDPYITGGWSEHEWGDALGDYMFSSQSKYGNVDGQTKFYIYVNSPDRLTSDEAAEQQLPDGTLGMRNFYEARGYAVDDAYNQPTSNTIAGGFTFAQYKAEIDAGRLVLIHLENTPQGHTIVGIGYDAVTNEVLLHDGWDDLTHRMPWGGSYVGMVMKMVSVIHPIPVDITKYTISGYVGAPNVTINYTGGSTTSLANGYYSFAVSPGWSGTVTPSKIGYSFDPPSWQYTNVPAYQMKQNYSATSVALQDPSFELGNPNPYWVGTSTNFETPLCTLDTCLGGQPVPNAAPRTGAAWGWLGGIDANETATLFQNITIPNSSSTNLEFYFWIGYAGNGSDASDVFTAKVDDTIVFSANATQINTYSSYTLVSVDISSFADGEYHTITFSSVTTTQQVDFNLDDVALVGTTLSSPPGSFNKSSPSNGAIQPNNLTLSWSESSEVVSYAYCYDTTNDNACSSWTSTGKNTFANISGLLSNTTYYWQVSASNVNGTTFADGSNTSYWSFRTVTEIPVVISIVRTNTNPTSASIVNFTVVFSEAVSGVTLDDFDLTTLGVMNASISSVTDTGDQTSYTVTVNTGSGNGTIRLDVVDDNTIMDAASNPLGGVDVGDGDFTNGEVYDINKEQILNGGFNTYPTSKSKIPTRWKAVKFSTTDGKTTTVKQEGKASVRITGMGVSKTLSQTLLLSGSTGDAFIFSFWVKGKSIPKGGVCRAQILFYNGITLNPIKPTINCVKGSYGFNQKTLTFTAPGNYTKIIVRFTYTKATGQVWFDAVSLSK
jgi:hypothetical protein